MLSPKNRIFTIKLNNFRGNLTDISAKTATLLLLCTPGNPHYTLRTSASPYALIEFALRVSLYRPTALHVCTVQ